MGIKRIVDVSFWTDGKVDEFSPEDKYFMLYLLTNPFTTQLGIYEMSVKQAAFQLGYSIESVKVLIDRFETKYKLIQYSKETNEVAIMNFLRHSIIKGGAPVRDCLVKELKLVKDRSLIAEVFAHVKGYEEVNETIKNLIAEYERQNGELRYCNDKKNDTSTIRERYVNDTYDNDNENDNENENENEKIYIPVIEYLNLKAGSHYRSSTPKTQRLIEARVKEGFNLEDFKVVIDKKCRDWKGTDMEQYLRPETLFGTKFEGYLNQREKIGTKAANPWDIESNDLSDLDDVF